MVPLSEISRGVHEIWSIAANALLSYIHLVGLGGSTMQKLPLFIITAFQRNGRREVLVKVVALTS